MNNRVKEREELLKRELNRIVETLKEDYQPEEIILFGSLATGKIHEWSDLDLIIVKETEKRPVDRCLEVYRIVRPAVGIDVFVYTPSEYRRMLSENVSFLRNAIRDGTRLYAQRD